MPVHLQNSQWQRSHSDWTERPEASKENIGLGGRSTFRKMYFLKEAPPVLKLAFIKINFSKLHIAWSFWCLALVLHCKPLVVHFKSLLVHFKTLLVHFTTLLVHSTTLLVHFKPFGLHFKPFVVHFKLLWCTLKLLWCTLHHLWYTLNFSQMLGSFPPYWKTYWKLMLSTMKRGHPYTVAITQ